MGKGLLRSTVAASLVAVGAVALAAPAETPFGRYHALVIGNNDYRSLPKLQTAVADAEAVSELLKQRYRFEVRLLRDATRGDILRALNDYRAELTESDNLLIYYAGHGYVDRQTDTGFWQPVDAEADDDLNWIANADLTRRLQAMTARHVMVIADSCYSGTLVRSSTGDLPTGHERQEWLKRMAEKRSRTAIVSGGIEPVADSGRDGHSVFAAALLDALSGNQEVLEASALFRQISRPVVVNAEQTPQYSDIRRAGHEGGEFLFVPAAAPMAVVAAEGSGEATVAGATRGGAGDKGIDLAFWQAAEGSGKALDYEAYLSQFPNGTFAPLARNRLAALQQADPSAKLTGKWVSEALEDPFNKGWRYRLHFDFRVAGEKLLGTLTSVTEPDSRLDYGGRKRALSDGRIDGEVITFAERFEVLMGSSTEQHERQFTGQLAGNTITVFQQDTLGNAPREFTLTRVESDQ